MARSDWRSRTRSRPWLSAPRRVNGRGRRIGRRRAQTNRGRRWEYLLFTWKTLGAGRASSAPSAPRPATSAAAVLASRGGRGGADMELRAPRGLPHRALCGEQGKTRRAAERGKSGASGEPRGETPPTPELPPKMVLAERGDPRCFIPLSVFSFKTVQWTASQVHRFFSDHFGDLCFLGTSTWPCTSESGREVAGGGDGNWGRGRLGTRGRGAGRALELDWVSVDFTLQRTRQLLPL